MSRAPSLQTRLKEKALFMDFLEMLEEGSYDSLVDIWDTILPKFTNLDSETRRTTKEQKPATTSYVGTKICSTPTMHG